MDDKIDRLRARVPMEHATADDILAVHVEVTYDPVADRFVAEVDNVPGAVGYDAVEHVAVIDALRSALAEVLVRLRKAEQERDNLRELLDAKSHEAGLYARRMGEAQAARNAAIAERARLRRELEALRSRLDDEAGDMEHSYAQNAAARETESVVHRVLCDVRDRIDAILRGGE